MFFIQLYVSFVKWLVIWPDLSRILQYLQFVVLQKENPLSFVEVPGYFCGFGTCIWSFWVVVVLVRSLVTNLSRVVCTKVPDVLGCCSGIEFRSVFCCTKEGLCISSPDLCGTLAEISMSRRFLGRLYPVINFFLWICAVVLLVPKMSQFFCTISRRESSLGLYVVVRNTLSVLSVGDGTVLGSSSLSRSRFLTVRAASSISEDGYPLLLKWVLIMRVFCSKSSILEQILLIRKN